MTDNNMNTSTDSLTWSAAHRPLNRRDVQTLTLSALGGALEFYDFVVYVFFAAVIGTLFFPPGLPDWLKLLQTFGIFAAGYLARPLGGIIIAHYGDKLGRKRMFTLSIFLMALPTLFMGLLPTYATLGVFAPVLLLILRVMQGAAIGGEVPGAWVFVSEHVPHNRTGLAVGSLTAGLTFGILLGALIATFINTHYSKEEVVSFAWRIPFILGGLFGLFAVYLRRFLEETPIFKELHQRKALSEGLPVAATVRNHLAGTLQAMLLTWVLSAAIVVVILFTPTWLQKVQGIAPALSLQANSLATLCLTLGCVVFGACADKFGGRLTLAIGSIGLLISSYNFYFSQPVAPGTLMLNYAITGFFVGVVGVVPYLMVRSFPAALRFSGVSFAYNVAYAIFGGLTPVAISAWLVYDKQAPAHYVAALCVLGVVLALAPQPKRH
ncbi:MFS transporter [Silvimonas iriomotensis]|uniref:MFS transporter n=1 Tax=Silvimonas iriomotensis TaxID=449662 RepID=A0ABQ2P7N8_9NEIS|nr:MFS transporter [Silvimonas iriomotensis]GGP20393.1 MFS transporter [Silvimonas iriomotensis]